jgi:AcrR family transcriptional regulator
MPPVSIRASARRAVTRRSAAVAPTALLQRKRQLVRQEIAHAAWLLFADRGYEETTVEAIAHAAGVSRRTFFRYFSSKEDVVVGTSDAIAEDVLAAFARRPKGEPPLVAIQRAIRPAIETRLSDAAEARAIVSLLRESRTLRRAMLERHARLEERLAVLIAERTGADPRRDPTPALLAFLARALMDTAFNVWYDQRPRDVGAMIDDLFRRLRSVVSQHPRGAALRRRKA